MALTNNLVSYYSCDEGSGTTLGDGQGSNNGTVVGATWTAGQVLNGLNFDGSNDYVNLGAGINSAFSGDFTINMWVKTTSSTGAYLTSILGTTSYLLFRNGDASLKSFKMSYNGQQIIGADGLSFNSNIETGNWVMLTAVRDNINGAYLYYNGVQDNWTYCNTAVTTLTDNVNLGRDGRGNNYLNGQMDEIGVWNRSLSASEITELYNSGDGLNPIAGVGVGKNIFI